MKSWKIGTLGQRLLVFSFSLSQFVQSEVVLSLHLMCAFRFWKATQQRGSRLLREHFAGLAKVVKQVWIVGRFLHFSLQIGDRVSYLAGLDLRNRKGAQFVNFLQVRNRIQRVAFGEVCVSRQPVRNFEFRILPQSPLQGNNGLPVFVLLHVCAAQTREPNSIGGLEHCCLAKFSDRRFVLVRLLGCSAGLNMLNGFGGGG